MIEMQKICQVVADDKVIIQRDNNEWKPGKIIRVDSNCPRFYIVKLDENGQMYVRNRRFLKKKNRFVKN